MITVALTKNLAGVNITASSKELKELYKSISSVLSERAENEYYNFIENHLYGFLYDVRHGYQEFEDDDICSFNYSLFDLLFDIIIYNTLLKKVKNVPMDDVIFVKAFYEDVIELLDEHVDDFEYIKEELHKTVLDEKEFNPMWYNEIVIKYLSLNKKQRKESLVVLIKALCNGKKYDEYYYWLNDITEKSKESGYSIYDYEINAYPKKIVW